MASVARDLAMGRKCGPNLAEWFYPGHPASPEAPPAVWGAIRALAHRHHLTRAEGLPQEHGERALDVQDGGGPLQGGRGTQAIGEALPASGAYCPNGRNDGMGRGGQRTRLSGSFCPWKQGYKLKYPQGPGRRTNK